MNKRSIREMNVIGIDISKAKLDCVWLRENKKVKSKVFSNQIKGWKALLSWAEKNTQESAIQFFSYAYGLVDEVYRINQRYLEKFVY